MDVIIFIVAILGSILSDLDFPTLYFYISLPYALHRCLRHTIRMMRLPNGRQNTNRRNMNNHVKSRKNLD